MHRLSMNSKENVVAGISNQLAAGSRVIKPGRLLRLLLVESLFFPV